MYFGSLLHRSSLRLIAACFFASAVVSGRADGQTANAEVLHNEQVVQMVVGRLSRDLILTKIRTTAAGYDLTSAGIIRLTTNKVHRDFIKAMMNASRETAGAEGEVGKEILTNESIIQMVAAGVDRELIDLKLQNTASAFDLSSTGMVRLTEQKVPTALIRKMMAPMPAVSENTAAIPVREPTARAAVKEDIAEPAKRESRAERNERIKANETEVRSTKAPLAHMPTEPGIWMRASDIPLTILEPNDYGGAKSDGNIGSAFSGGMARRKIKAIISSAEAAIHTADDAAEFYFVFEAQTSTKGVPFQGWSCGMSSPNQFVLLKMDKKKNSREVTLASAGAFGAQSGTDEKQVVPIAFTRIRPGLYRVYPKNPLAPGQYGFFTAALTGPGAPCGTRLFDFGVNKP
jgi:hypothetical protein